MPKTEELKDEQLKVANGGYDSIEAERLWDTFHHDQKVIGGGYFTGRVCDKSSTYKEYVKVFYIGIRSKTGYTKEFDVFDVKSLEE